MSNSDSPGGSEAVLTDQDGHVGVVTLNRPGAMNTFSTGLATTRSSSLRPQTACGRS